MFYGDGLPINMWPLNTAAPAPYFDWASRAKA